MDPLDHILSREDERSLPEPLRPLLLKYGYIDGHGRRVLCWDLARFQNHSCRPASLSPGLPFDIAVRDLEVGDELTCDYGALNIEKSFACMCSQPGCRGTVNPDDMLRLAGSWDEALRAAATRLAAVAQPLWDVVSTKEELRDAADNPGTLPSVLGHYFAAKRALGAAG